MVESGLPRRDFVKAAAGSAAAGALVPMFGGRAGGIFGNRKMIGIQVGAVSFVDEGVTRALDMLQLAASVNAPRCGQERTECCSRASTPR